MDYIVHPLKGVNNIEFGMNFRQVRQLMDATPREFRRHDEIHPSDFFSKEGVFAYYDSSGHLEAIEFSSRARAILGVVNILGLPFGQAAALLKQIDPNVVFDRDSVTSKSLSLSIWSAAGFAEAGEAVEAFLTGRPGYYDDLDPPIS